jgi:hypothetical protein
VVEFENERMIAPRGVRGSKSGHIFPCSRLREYLKEVSKKLILNRNTR